MATAIKGRGATGHLPGRFETITQQPVDDGWYADDGEEFAAPALRTQVTEETARSIISRNQSPDIGFSQSVNPYRGCEHGCSYCFARPSHAYLNLSPGLDFETKLFAKTNAPELLRRELSRPGYVPSPIALGINTDAYQPIERKRALTRRLIEVLWETRHPFTLITKNALVTRDLDLLAPLAREGLVNVHFSVTTLDPHLSARLEPRASAPHARLRAMRALHEAGVPVGVMAAPVIPWINDHELEAILQAASAAGAHSAGYVLLRLPHEVAPLFRDWLQTHHPQRAGHVMSTIQQLRGGKDYDSTFGTRLRGQGVYAELLARRFALAHRRSGFDARDMPALDTTKFRRPAPPAKPVPQPPQGSLF
ncbi:PA0069 family radical SAM protein [Xanthomonas arboricola pv. juglandis]|uniref:PA0069 family radical SAM protein n=1 Tax=Xanthomonas arboricola TaxID=56448 RepID=UPI0025AEF70A|nr:PA0069 family radical SAM protein [Xanthomonas arboricola]MDN0242453.1 PA0069 family radical SAM protein [Xanthomonas arboricola pv. juglandis]MDN0255308.1 PA0069 family radical SAM protein [Xanthomonas arboricola pv. juglandis]MDN0259087.1 PA0069 family radical SAM protein [Xanthomonas arboricola pv. juglandis]MDN0263265.1 PA0069 family radical SAM protein [Xanthomonas arboricola pv. juglandis]